mgnify:CR=1 FL=1
MSLISCTITSANFLFTHPRNHHRFPKLSFGWMEVAKVTVLISLGAPPLPLLLLTLTCTVNALAITLKNTSNTPGLYMSNLTPPQPLYVADTILKSLGGRPVIPITFPNASGAISGRILRKSDVTYKSVVSLVFHTKGELINLSLNTRTTSMEQTE